jgi:hypothetical protein
MISIILWRRHPNATIESYDFESDSGYLADFVAYPAQVHQTRAFRYAKFDDGNRFEA